MSLVLLEIHLSTLDYFKANNQSQVSTKTKQGTQSQLWEKIAHVPKDSQALATVYKKKPEVKWKSGF